MSGRPTIEIDENACFEARFRAHALAVPRFRCTGFLRRLARYRAAWPPRSVTVRPRPRAQRPPTPQAHPVASSPAHVPEPSTTPDSVLSPPRGVTIGVGASPRPELSFLRLGFRRTAAVRRARVGSSAVGAPPLGNETLGLRMLTLTEADVFAFPPGTGPMPNAPDRPNSRVIPGPWWRFRDHAAEVIHNF